MCVEETGVEHLVDRHNRLDEGGDFIGVVILLMKNFNEHSMSGLHLL